ncbi:ankyrin repeat-containing domain protein [Dichotomocladium elegans]|nr:ankyrin repeat-containing domain protein [Dichotomocladium elegans]
MDNLSYSFDRVHIGSNNRSDLPLSARDCLVRLLDQVQDDNIRHRAQAELRQLLTNHEQLISVLQQRTQAVENENNQLKTMIADQQQRYEKAVREMQFFKKKYDMISKQSRRTSISSESPSEISAHSNSQNGNGNIKMNGSTSTSSVNSHQYQPNTPLPSVPPPQQHSLPPVPEPEPINFPLTPTSPQPSVNSGDISHLLKPSRSSSSSTASSNVQHYQSFWSNNLNNAPPLPSNASIHSSSSSSATASRYQHAPSNSIYSFSSTEGSGPYQQYQSIQPLPQQPLSPPPPPPSFQQPLSPPLSVPSYASVPRHNASVSSASGPASYGNFNVVQQRRVDPLMYGGSDSLWDTIAKNKGKDPAVEKIVSDFLRRGGSPNAARQTPSVKSVKLGYGLVHAAVTVKALSTLDLLLQQGANPNAMTLSEAIEDKVSPCYLAARIGWLPGLQRLVQAGADLIQARGEGTLQKTALHTAAEHCHAAVVEFIVGYTEGALNLELDSQGATALHYAAQSGHADLVSFLIRSCHIPADQVDNRGEQPIHWASRAGCLEVVSLLVERFGVDCNAYVPKSVPTPLELAKSNKHKRVIDYLKGAGGLSSKKMDKKREEEEFKNSSSSKHLQSTLARNGLLGDDGFF